MTFLVGSLKPALTISPSKSLGSSKICDSCRILIDKTSKELRTVHRVYGEHSVSVVVVTRTWTIAIVISSQFDMSKLKYLFLMLRNEGRKYIIIIMTHRIRMSISVITCRTKL
jgi:hypothetical protein